MDKFVKLGLRKSIADGICSFGFTAPTWIQSKAVPELLLDKSSSFVVSAPTGDGKTLLYLSALAERIKRREEATDGTSKMSLPRRPQAVVIAPTRELGEQITGVAKRLAGTSADFRARGLLAKVKNRILNQELAEPMDILVATPGSLVNFRHQQQRLFYSHVQEVVLDEADVLLTGKGFEELTSSLVRMFPSEKTRFVYVGATMSSKLIRAIHRLHPKKMQKLRVIVDRDREFRAHKTGVRIEFVHFTQNASKRTELRHALRRHKKTLIFCRTTQACRYVLRTVEEMGFPCTDLHGEYSKEQRHLSWKRFKMGEVTALACTDVLSRGIDDPDIDCVLNFDFPDNTTDYLHRAGRLRGRGSLISLVDNFSLNWARTVFLGHAQNQNLEHLQQLEWSQLQRPMFLTKATSGVVFRDARDPEEEDLRHRRWIRSVSNTLRRCREQ